MKSIFHSTLAAIVICLTSGIDVSAEDRFLEQEPDSYLKLGDIKGEYKNGTPAARMDAQDWLSELDYLIWEAEADDFFWRGGKRSPSGLPNPWIWEDEAGDF